MLKGIKMSFESYLCLEASAGSGKTFALSVRYIALLLQGNHPSKILALTFTNKAANEMFHRIITTFCNLHEDKQKGELAELCELLDKEPKQILALRDEMMDEFLSSELKISTFDSFFATILRQFSLNLGIMPDFNSVENNKILVKNEFKKLLISNSMITSVAKYLNSTNSKESDLFDKLDMLSQCKFKPYSAICPTTKLAMKKYEELCDVALKLSSHKNYIKNFNKNLSLKDIVEKPIVKAINTDYFEKVIDNAEFNSARDAFISAAKEYYLALEKYEIAQISNLINLYKQAIINVNRRENSLSFADIANWVNELLTSKNKQDIDMLYFRLDARIKHILIDEFQDTSVNQYEILEPLIAESVAGIGQSGLGSFFYVGDTKQSIYRFRGGQSGLFNKLKDDFSQIKTQNLGKNYRSDKFIVEYVNNIFRSKYTNYIDQIPNSKDDGYVKVDRFDFNEYLDKIYENITHLSQSGVAYSDMAILCWKNDDIYKIKNFLESKGLIVSTQMTNMLIKSANVAAVVAFVKYCILGDEIYSLIVYEILKSKNDKLELKIDAPISSTLKFIAKYLGIEPYDIDMLKLYEISNNYSDIYDFIFNIDEDQTKSAKSSQNGITIMTLHKSKGLQFDHVIVMDSIAKSSVDKNKFLIEYDLNSNRWEIRLNNKAFENLGDESYIKLKNRQKELDKIDKINALYVALTRAKHSLIILAKDDPNGKNISYFTQYISNHNTVEYLNLDECELGSIKPAIKEQESSLVKPVELEPFIKVARQEIVKDDEIKSEKNLDLIYFGNALHYYLESLNFNDIKSQKIANNCLYNRFGAYLDSDCLEDIISRANRLINNIEFLEIIDGKELYKEQEIGFNGALKRIDLLCMNESEIYIVDYKSSDKNLDKDRAQVEQYLEILSQIYPDKSVKAAIIYILSEKIQILKL